MKRVSSACICQTLHFMLKEDAAHDHAVRLVARKCSNTNKRWSAAIPLIKSSAKPKNLTAPSSCR